MKRLVTENTKKFAYSSIMYGGARLALIAQLYFINKYLSAATLSIWVVLDSYLTFVLLVSDLGLKNHALRNLSKLSSTENRLYESNVYIKAQLFTSVFMFSIFSVVLCELYNISYLLVIMVSVSYIVLGASSIEWYWMSSGDISRVAKQRMMYELAVLILLPALLKYYDIYGYVCALILGSLVILLYNKSIIKVLININRSDVGSEVLKLVRKSIPLFILTILGQVWLREPIWILAKINKEEIGWFWISFKLFIVALEALSVLNQIFYPKIAKSFADYSGKGIGNHLANCVPEYIFLTKKLSIIISLMAFAALFYAALFQNEYTQWVCIGSALGFCYAMWSDFSPKWNFLIIANKEFLLSKLFLISILLNATFLCATYFTGILSPVVTAFSFLASTSIIYIILKSGHIDIII